MRKLFFIIFACAAIGLCMGACGSGSEVPAGNVNNYGFLLVEGNDIYYTKVIVSEMGLYGNIYKYNTASKSEILVAETVVDYYNQVNAYLTLHNGYLYFLPYFALEPYGEVSPNIYRVKPDGNNIVPEALIELGYDDEEPDISFMQIVDKTIYYYDYYEEILYSMKPDGTNRKVVCSDAMESISISGGKAYFADYGYLKSVSLKGGEAELIYDFSEVDEEDDELEDYYSEIIYLEHIIADKNYIYYLDDEGMTIGRIRTNGTNHEVIYTAEEGTIVFFNISGDMIFIGVEDYGTDEFYALLSVGINGGTAREVVGPSEQFIYIAPVSIWGDTIYFNAMHFYESRMDSSYVWYTVRKGGGSIVPWRPFNIVNDDYIGADWLDWFDEDWDDEDWEDD